MGSLSLHRYHGILAFLGACLVSFTPLCNGGNILVFPVDGSHWINMKILLEELHANGHTLTVLRASTSWYIPEKSSIYTTIILEMGDEDNFDDFFDKYLQEVLRAQIEGASVLTQFKTTKELLLMLQKAHVILSEIIDQLLGDEKMVQSLRDAQYDLVLTDPAMAQGVLLAKYLKLPVVLNVRWATSEEGHFMMAPSPLSYVPVPGSGLTDKMDFFQRIKNVFFYGIIRFQQRFMIGPGYDTICRKYIEGRCDIDSLLQEADIWLFRSDFVFDFPRPTMPNIIYIGGFQCKPPQPLPADLEAFVQSAGEHGVIIMTLGTLVKALPSDVADEIAAVFAKMPQKVIWKHSGPRPSTVGNNTLLVDWMPQKDLLGHPQTKAFVAHGGTNGVQEAIYHGVPVLGIPLFFDQYDNLLRLQARGAGKILLLTDINGHNFEQHLKEVLHEKSYRENIQRMSRLHRDQPMSPMERAVFWVEYVIRNKGAPHLRTEAYKMPWYAYHSFDVFLFLFTIVCVLLYSIVAVFRFLCCRRRSKTKTKQQ